MSGIFSGFEPASSINILPIVIFDTVAITATISLALTLAPAVFCSNVHRSKAWFSMITTMTIFPLLYLLNIGSQFHAEESPPIGLCILQAGFVYAGPPACTTAVLCFITDMTLGLRAMLFKKKRNEFFTSTLIVMPSIIFACIFFEAIALVNGKRGVHFDFPHMFCESDDKGPQVKISAILTLISLALTICMEVWTIVLLYRNWAAVRSFRRTRNRYSTRGHDSIWSVHSCGRICGSTGGCGLAEQFAGRSRLEYFHRYGTLTGGPGVWYTARYYVRIRLLEEGQISGRSE